MSFKIGYTEFDCGPNSGSIVRSKSQISFTIEIDPGTFAAAQVIEAQLRGYHDTGNVVPVIWGDDSSWDGYYTVEAASVSPIENYLSNGVMYAQMSLSRQSDALEVFTSQSVLSTVDHAVSPNGAVFIPGGWFHQSLTGPDGAASGIGSLQIERLLYGGGSVVGRETSSTVGAGTFAYQLPLSSFYDGSTVLEVFSGGLWHHVSDADLASASDDIRLSNGVVRFSWLTSGVMRLEVSSASTWVTVAEHGLYIDASYVDANLMKPSTAPLILHNDPLGVVARYPLTYGATPLNFTRFVDVSIRRGESMVTASFSYGDLVGVGPITAAAATSFTGGIRLTADDSNGHRWVAGCEAAYSSSDLANGRFAFASSNMFLGVERDGSAATTYDTAGALAQQYWAPVVADQVPVRL